MHSAVRFPFESNFDVSVVMPFYKKLDVFSITLQKNAVYFQRNGIELVIIMDELTEQEGLLALIKRFPLINWRVIVNEQPHAWRNPAKVINVGIRAAEKKYILVMGPDSELAGDVILAMRAMASNHERCFFVGRVAFVDYDYFYTRESLEQQGLWYYGSLFAEKEHLVAIGGYDEKYQTWGGDDDNIRARLERYGLKKMKLPECVLLHRESKGELQNSRVKEKGTYANRDKEQIMNSYYPHRYIANDERGWGHDFDKVIYDWRNNAYGEELCRKYLLGHDFEAFDVKPHAFTKQYGVIALIAACNEHHHIPELLGNIDRHCDGIILLDDASEDDTYELAEGQKLIMRVKKRCRKGFDDRTNRNLLLDLGSFFSVSFFFFIDADERLDERYCNLRAVAASGGSDTFCFHLVHLWNSDKHYRADVPEPSTINQPGILQRWRMFRNIGRMNIDGDRLHFEATPYKNKKLMAPILIKHYGLISPEIRSIKYQRYHSEDDKLKLKPDKYDYFLHQDTQVRPVSEIIIPDV